jgi:hypothetical protein
MKDLESFLDSLDSYEDRYNELILFLRFLETPECQKNFTKEEIRMHIKQTTEQFRLLLSFK